MSEGPVINRELKSHNDVLNRMDSLFDELLDDQSNVSIEKLETLIMKIQTLIHHKQKEIDRKIARSDQDFEDAHRKREIASYRGHTVMIVTMVSGGLHMLSGVAGLAPDACVRGATTFNSVTTKITRGRIIDPIQLGHLDSAEKITAAATRTFEGGAKLSEGVQNVVGNRQTSNTREEQSRADRFRLQNQNDDQEAQRKGNLVDNARQQESQEAQKTYQAKIAILR